VAGNVESVATLRNQLTGVEFQHVRIRTISETLIDVVAPGGSEPLPAKPTLALAQVWLVGCPVHPPPTAGGGFWRRLVGKA
jgi:hypothetical protein